MVNPTASPDTKALVLKSWKDIANYLGCGVRTVQRYEHTGHFPVKRVPGKSRGAVFALATEIDAWLRYAGTAELDGQSVSRHSAAAVHEVHESILRGANLRRESRELRSAHHHAVKSLSNNIFRLMESSRPTN